MKNIKIKKVEDYNDNYLSDYARFVALDKKMNC